MQFEFDFLNWIQETLRCGFLDKFFIGVTTLGNAGIMWILMAIVMMFFKKWRKAGIALAVAIAFCGLFGNLLLKPLVARERPFAFSDIQLLIKAPTDYSFPSGHTYPAFAAAALMFIYKYKARIIVLIIACLIAFSRMYLYVHYPTDILGGIIMGIGCAILGYFTVEKWYPMYMEHRRQKQQK